MPFEYERDDVKRQIVVRFQGPFQKDEAVAFFDRLRLEDIGSYSLLYDLRNMEGQPTVFELRSLMSEQSSVSTNASRGPIAMVTTDQAMYAMACTYAVLSHPKLTVQVFRELIEADAWLVAQTQTGPGANITTH